MKCFLKRKQINISFKSYFIDAFGAMALGLFASLLTGTIFDTVYDKTERSNLYEFTGYSRNNCM